MSDRGTLVGFGFGLDKLSIFISRIFLAGFLFSFSSIYAQSGPGKFNVSGGLFNSNGTAITNANVNFRIEVYDSAATCLLYSEQHLAQDLSATKGGFSLEIGLGTSQSNPLEGTSAFSSKIFHNPGVVGAFSGCASGVTLASGSDRLIRVSYDLGSGFVAMTPDVPITSAPYAMVAETLQGKTPSDFILTNVNTQLSQNSMEYLFTNTNYANLKALVDGTSTQYMVSNPASDVSFNSRKLVNVADPTSAQDAATKNYSDTFMGGQPVDMTGVAPGIGGNSVLAWDQVQNKWVARTFGSVSSITAGTGLTGGTIVSAGTLSVDVGTTANKILQLNGSAQIPAVNGSLLTNVNAVQLWSRDVSSVAPTAGQVLTWNVSGSIWEASTPSGGTITALVGDVTASGSGAVTATIANNAINSAKINSTGISKNLLLITDNTTGAGVGYMSCSLGQVLQWDANGWGCVDMSVALGTSGVTAGTYGSDTMVPRVTVDAQGRVTALSNVNIAFPVTTVAGRTGAVTLIASDIGGLGTAALVNVGTGSSNVPQLDAFGRMPAVDGSQLTNLTAGSVSGVASGTGLVGGTITTYGTLSVDVGTTPNKILQLTAGAQIPAVDGNLVTNVNAVKIQARNVSATAPNPGQVLGWNGSSSQWEPASVTSGTVTQVASGTGLLGGPISSTGTLSVDVGTGANQIVQLDSSAKLPGVDGSALSNLNATRIGTRTVATTAPGVGQILSWNNSTSQWEPMAPATSGTVTNVATGNGLLGGPITNNGTLSVDTGTTGNKILQLTAGAQIPAVDGNLVTNVNAVKLQARDVASTAPTSGQVLAWNNLSSVWEPRSVTSGTVTTVSSGTGLLGGPISSNGTLSVDVGTGANQIVQLDSSAKLPAVDGSALSNLNATRIGTRTIATTAPSTGQYIGWNNSTSQWEPMAPATSGTVTNVATGNGLLGGPITNNGTLSVDTGVTGNKILQLTAGAQIPAVDGNLVTNVNAVKLQARNVSSAAPGGGQVLGWNALNSIWEPTFVTNGTVIQISSGTGLLGGPISSTGTLSVDVGTSANQIVQLDSSAKLPGVDGSALSNLNATRIGTRTVATTAPGAGQVLSWNNLNSQWEPMAPATSGTVTNVATGNGLLGGPITNNGTLSVDTGVTGNKILQLTAGAQIPAVDGNLVTNVNAVKLQARNVAATAPVTGQVLGWNGLSGVWEPMSTAVGSVTNVVAGTGLLGGPISSSGTLSVDVGTTGNKILQLTAGAQIPAVDGNLVTNVNAVKLQTRDVAATAPTSGQVLSWNNLSSVWEPRSVTSGTVTTVSSGTGLLGGPISSNGTLSVDVGTGANQIVQLDSSAKLPAVDGYQLTNLNATRIGTRAIATTAPSIGQYIGWNNSTSQWEPMAPATSGTVTNVATGTGLLGGPISNAGTLSVDVGTTSNKILQLTATAQIPAVDGNLVTNVNAVKLQTRNVAATAPVSGQVLGWNGSSGMWEPMSTAVGSVTNITSGTGLLGGPISSLGTLSVDVGTGANQIVQLDSSAKLPAVDGSSLSNLNATRIGTRSIATTAPSTGQYIGWNNSTTQWEPMAPATSGTVTNVATGTGLVGGPISNTGTISVDVGTTSNKILQLTASAQIPAVDGALVTNVNAVKIQARDIAPTAPTPGQVLAWNALSSVWEPTSATAGSVTQVQTGTGLIGGPISSTGTISVDVGTTSNKILQLNASGQIPAVDGSLITNINGFRNGGNAYGANSTLGNIDNYSLSILTNNTARIFIDPTGNIGIGTVSPTEPLQISKDQNSQTVMSVKNLATGGVARTIVTSDAGSLNMGANGSTFATNPIYGGPSAASIWTSSGLTNGLAIGAKAGSIRFFTDGTQYERMRIDLAGNVGIGTSTPLALLDLQATTSGSSAVIVPRDTQANRPPTGVNGMIRYNTSTSKFEAFENNAWVSMTPTGAGATAAGAVGEIQFSNGLGGFVSNINMVYLNGNVGIGTLTPASQLHVSGSFTLERANIASSANTTLNVVNGNTSGYPIIFAKKSNGGDLNAPGATLSGDTLLRILGSGHDGSTYAGRADMVFGAEENFSGTAAGTLIRFGTTAAGTHPSNPTERMRISSNGNVGIGTSSPQALLDLQTTASGWSAVIIPRDTLANRPPIGVNGMIRYNTSTSKFEAFENNAWVSMTPSGSGVGSTGNSGTLQLSNGTGGFISNNNVVLNSTTGNLGIGTSNPVKKLDISGGRLRITDSTGAAVELSNGTDAGYVFTDTVANGSHLNIRTDSARNLALQTGGGTTGSVGIGTLSPGAPAVANGISNLDVIGSGRFFRQLQINSAGSFPQSPKFQMTYQGTEYVRLQGDLMNGGTTSSDLSFWTTNSDTIQETMRLRYDGRVGIGTSLPQAILDVATTTSGRSAIIVPRDTQANRPLVGVNGMIRYNTSTSKFEAFENNAWVGMTPSGAGATASGNSGALQFSNGSGGFASNNNIVVNSSTGYIGIGTTSAANQLHIYASSNSLQTPIRLQNGDGSATGTAVGMLLKGGTSGGAKSGIAFERTASWGLGKLHFMVDGTGDASDADLADAKMTIAEYGNVGIGTVSPGTTLHVYGANAAGIVVERSGSLNSGIEFRQSGASAFVGIATNSNFSISSSSNLSAGVVQVTSSGNVGVGTANPQALLDLSTTTSGWSAIIVPRDTTGRRPPTGVNGMIRYNTTTNRLEAFEANAWVSMTPSGAGMSSAGASGALQYTDGSGAFLANNNIVIDGTNGRIGLGVTAPHRLLTLGGYDTGTTIDSSRTATIRIMEKSATVGGVAGIQLGGAAQSDTSIQAAIYAVRTSAGGNGLSDLLFATHSSTADSTVSEKFRLTGPGSVGIGTSTPRTILEVSTTTSGQSAIIVPRDTTANRPPVGVNGMIRYNTNSNTMEAFTNGSWNSFGFSSWNSGASNSLSYTAGNVGIGTTSPTEKLELSGGNIKMGYEQVYNTCAGPANNGLATCTVTCTGTKYVLSGGCSIGGGAANIQNSYPTTNSWVCTANAYASIGGAATLAAHAICADIR